MENLAHTTDEMLKLTTAGAICDWADLPDEEDDPNNTTTTFLAILGAKKTTKARALAAITEEAFDEAIAKWRIKDAIPSPVLIASAGLVGTVARLVCGVKPTKEAVENI